MKSSLRRTRQFFYASEYKNKKPSVTSSRRVFQQLQFDVSRVSWGSLSRLPHISQSFHRRRFLQTVGVGYLGQLLLDFRWHKVSFQIIEVDHLPMTTFSWCGNFKKKTECKAGNMGMGWCIWGQYIRLTKLYRLLKFEFKFMWEVNGELKMRVTDSMIDRYNWGYILHGGKPQVHRWYTLCVIYDTNS